MNRHSQKQLQQFLEVATEAAFKGGEVLKQYWGKLSNVRSKSYSWDLVTDADLGSEKAVLHTLKMAFPDHTTLSEESGLNAVQESDYQWVVDPLDGTTNYTHQYPMVAVSIGLLYQKQPLVGVVYNPIFEELFQAAAGLGATLNGKPIQVSKIDLVEKSLLATGFAYDRKGNPDANYSEFIRLTQLCHGVRRLGSAAIDLAYVAAGRLEGFWERGLKPWDTVAGSLLVIEAGGQISNYDLSSFDYFGDKILATNGKIHKQLSHILLP